MNSSQGRLAVQAVHSIAARYLMYGIGLVGSVVLARSLQAGGRGAYAYATTIGASLVAVAHLSVEHALLYEWARTKRAALLGVSLLAAATVGTVAALLAVVVVAMGALDLPDGVDNWMLYLVVAAVPMLLAAQYVNSMLVNDGQIRAVNWSELLMTSARVVALLALALIGALDVATALIVWAVSLPLLVFAKLRPAVLAMGVAMPSLSLLRTVVAKGLRYHVGALSLAMILRIDVLLLATLVPVEEVGRYALAVTLAELAIRAGEASSQVAVQAQIEPDDRLNTRVTARVARLNVLLGATLLLALVAVGPTMIGAVFGRSFDGTTPAIAALAPGIVALGFERPLGIYIVRQDRPLLLSAGMFATLLLNVALNLLLIPAWGIVGAALASSVAYVVLATWMGAWFVRASGVQGRELVPRLAEAAAVIRTVTGRAATR